MATYYVATNGSDARTTVQAQNIATPWASWGHAMSQVVAGDTVYIRGGTYTALLGTVGQWAYGARVYNKQGTSGAWITIQNYQNEVPILDCAALANIDNYHMGLMLEYTSYVKIKGLEVRNVRESNANPHTYTACGWAVADSDNIILENCVVTGSVQGFSVNGSIDGLQYINCDAHHNWDFYQYGDLCNGFSGNAALGSSITYVGCRSWYNSDDGFDNADGAGIYTYDKCWAWKNGPWNPGIDYNGNGEGFKLGWSVGENEPTQPARTVTNCISAVNILSGFSDTGDNQTHQNMWFFNCSSFGNTTQNFGLGQGTDSPNIATIRNCLSYKTGGIAYNSWQQCQYRNNTIQSNNTWNYNYGLTDASFESLDYTQMEAARKADGSLPDITFLKPKVGTATIGAGVEITAVSIPTDVMGVAMKNPPDIGAFQYAAAPPSTPTVTIEGQTYPNGVDVRQAVTTNLIFRNNLITGQLPAEYMLLAGNEVPGSGDNKEDGEIITGNMFDWNGADSGVECIQAGYNINQVIKYNYFDSPTYGVVLKSGNVSTGNMNNATGVVAYNIFKNVQLGLRIKGFNGAQIYNNTFYDNVHGSVPGMIYITNNPDNGVTGSINTKIKNNIFYSVNNVCFISVGQGCDTGFESDYNIFFAEAGDPLFGINNNGLNFAQWQALGYDTHSVMINPSFLDTTLFVPSARLNHGVTMADSVMQSGLSTTAAWSLGVSPGLTAQNGTWQNGAIVYAAVASNSPTVTTTAISSITSASAVSGGNVTSDGGASVTARGVCWGLTPNPTIANSRVINYNGTGTFSSYIWGLVPGTTYHVRAYATNSVGTSYGADVSFTTANNRILITF